MPPYFIAIHAGAGAFSADPAREADLKAAMREACEAGAAIMCLGSGGASPDPALAALTSAIAPAPADLALAAAAAAVASLEDWPGANAGVGSSLTEAGRVECDASAMAGDGAWGGAAAARGVRHPATVAAALAAESRLAMPLGRVRPILLAGSGVRSWAAARGLGVLALADEHCRGGGGEGGPPAALGWQVTPRTHAQWAHWSEMAAAEAAVTAAGGGCHGHLVVSGRWVAAVGGAGDAPSGEDGGGGEGAPAEQPVKRRRRLVTGTHASPPLPPPAGGGGDGSSEDGDDDCPGDDADLTPPHDTVGAVVVCGLTGATAAAVSSGGLALKSPGRVGEAAIFGAGCWAEDGRAGGDGAAASSSPSATLPPGVVGIAASVSGVGEVIIRSGLARAAAASVAGGGVDALAGAVAAAAVAGAGVQPGAPVDCGALVVRALRSCSPGAQSTGAAVVATVEAAVAAQAEGMAFAYRWEGHGGGSGEEVLRSGRGRRGVQFSVSAPLAAG